MIAGIEDRFEDSTDWSGIVFPIGLSLRAATFSWLEEAVQQRSAEDIYAGLAQRRPDVMLKSRVPTFTLPRREFAAGDWLAPTGDPPAGDGREPCLWGPSPAL